MRPAREAETTEASTDNQSQNQREKDKSLQPEEKLGATTSNETGIHSKKLGIVNE